MLNYKKDSTDEVSIKYKLLRLALILEKQSLKTPLNILRIYTNVKWRFNQTTDFDYQSNQVNEIRRSQHCQLSSGIQYTSLKQIVKEIQIKNYTERVHNQQQKVSKSQKFLKELVELAREKSQKRNSQKKQENITKDVYQNIYELSILLVFVGFIGSMFFVITQQIQNQ